MFILFSFVFSQVVWKNSKQIGAAQQVRGDGRLVVVIRYNPPGNFNTDGAFAANVLPARLDNGSGVCDVRSSSVFTAYVVALGLIFNFPYWCIYLSNTLIKEFPSLGCRCTTLWYPIQTRLNKFVNELIANVNIFSLYISCINDLISCCCTVM